MRIINLVPEREFHKVNFNKQISNNEFQLEFQLGNFQIELFKWIFLVNLLVNLSVNSSLVISANFSYLDIYDFRYKEATKMKLASCSFKTDLDIGCN